MALAENRLWSETLLPGPERNLFLDNFFRQNSQRLFRFARRLSRNDHDAHDLVAEALRRALMAPKPLTALDEAVKLYFYRTISRLAIDRAKRKSASELTEFVKDPANHFGVADNCGLETAIKAALSQLPEDYQVVIRLRHFDELTLQEIADKLKIPIGTVKSRLFRGMHLLGFLLQEYSPHRPV